MSIVAAMSGVLVPLQVAATTGNGDVVCPPMSFRNHTFIIKGNGTIGAGAVQIETADDPEYTGTWAAAPKADGTTTTPVTVVSSAELAVVVTGIFTAMRARISTTVTTTNVTVQYLGGKNF